MKSQNIDLTLYYYYYHLYLRDEIDIDKWEEIKETLRNYEYWLDDFLRRVTGVKL